MAKSDGIRKAILAAEKVFVAAYNRHDAPALAGLCDIFNTNMPEKK